VKSITSREMEIQKISLGCGILAGSSARVFPTVFVVLNKMIVAFSPRRANTKNTCAYATEALQCADLGHATHEGALFYFIISDHTCKRPTRRATAILVKIVLQRQLPTQKTLLLTNAACG
jgi:hypothetical protein